MKNRIGRVMLALALVIGATPFAADDAAAWVYPCQNGTPQSNLFIGRGPDTAANETGVSARLEVGLGFQICDSGFDPNRGSSAWVAITPGQGNNHYGDRDAIVQVGIIQCGETIVYPQVCTGVGDVVLFYADGGCNGDGPGPQYLGEASAITTYQLEVRMDATWVYFLVDGSGIALARNSTHINCWIDGTKDFEIAGERWDNGDSTGVPGDPVMFTNMKRKYNGVWFFLNNSGACELFSPVSGLNAAHCTYPTSTSMNIWNG